MLLRVMSDLHLEQFEMNWFPPKLDTDKDTTLVLAGDLAESFKIIEYAKNTSKHIRWLDTIANQFKYVVFVAGNHCVWGTDLYSFRDKMIEKTSHLDNVFFLQNDWVVLEGILFTGCTLWTDFGGKSPMLMWDAKSRMNDYRYIKKKKINGEYTRITPEDILQEHIKSVKFLYNTLSDVECKKVMITHHHPSFQTKSRIYTAYNEYYNSDLDDMIIDLKPDLIVSGHSHESFDQMLYDSRFVCNPLAYGRENENGFNPNLIVEI